MFWFLMYDESQHWQADPRCNWAILSLKDHDGTENDIPVSAILSSHLADAHHQVRMLVATSVERYGEHGSTHKELKSLSW